MREVLPGVYHWQTFDGTLAKLVHSYYVGATSPALLIDPRRPPEGLAWFSARQEPKDILLTSSVHHDAAVEFAATFGARIWCHDGERVKLFAYGDRLPGGVSALPLDAWGSGESAFYLPLHGGVVALGNALAGMVPDAAKAMIERLAARPIKHWLLASQAVA